MRRFENRRQAGKILAQQLSKYAGRGDTIALALPRGGVPVAYEIAVALKIPLDVLIVRKLGVPGHQELALGAIASGGIRVLNQDVIDSLVIDPTVIDSVTEQESQELARRDEQFRGRQPPPNVYDRTVIVIDDGLATGASMLAAVRALRTQHPARIVVAVPAAAPQAIVLLRPDVDEIVYGIAPDPFEGVGKWYQDFSQTTDEEVRSLLEESKPQS